MKGSTIKTLIQEAATRINKQNPTVVFFTAGGFIKSLLPSPNDFYEEFIHLSKPLFTSADFTRNGSTRAASLNYILLSYDQIIGISFHDLYVPIPY